MCTSFVPATAARAGYQATLLAERGFTASDGALEGVNGYCDVFSLRANPSSALDGLGTRWEILDNAFKPYPCGIVIHPVLDACLDIAANIGDGWASIDAVEIEVNPICLMLCDRPNPDSSQLAQVSVQHWAAAALVRGQAGLNEGAERCVFDNSVVGVRNKIDTQANEAVPREGARVRVRLADGSVYDRTIEHAIGSLGRPMTNQELEDKFHAQAGQTLTRHEQTQKVIDACWAVSELDEAITLIQSTTG